MMRDERATSKEKSFVNPAINVIHPPFRQKLMNPGFRRELTPIWLYHLCLHVSPLPQGVEVVFTDP